MNPTKLKTSRCTILAALTAALLLSCGSGAWGRTVLKNICHVKGMEETSLQGLGLVIGLKGTGDGAGSLPTIRALAQTMRLLGNPLPVNFGKGGKTPNLQELKDAKNVALVMVSVTVPAAGGQRGDKLDCHVSAISAKSLEGGRLFLAPLLGPNPTDRNVYAIAQGQIELDDPGKAPAVGKILRGCMLEQDFVRQFVFDNQIMLVLNKSKADFQVASDVAETINTLFLSSVGAPSSKNRRDNAVPNGPGAENRPAKALVARALDKIRIVVPIPPAYLADPTKGREADPILFLAEVLSLPLAEPQIEARVVINMKTGAVAVSGDVEIGAVAITHKNVTIEAGGDLFFLLDPEDRALTSQQREGTPPKTKLTALLSTLNKIHVPKEDIIAIIKVLDESGKLHGHVVVQ